ncbi:MAG: response regulator [Thermodesulfovibrionia bacterium]|nr:response regulator [Thermodesulfovibrionia bacterium]
MAQIKYDIKRGADIYREIYGARLQKWISTGKIKRGEVLVWRSGLSGWRKAEELEELAPFFKKWEERELGKIKREKPDKFLTHKKQIRNILIIDDEQDMCSLLHDALSRKKYNVAIANTMGDAIGCIKRTIPDLIFLDLRLPDGDGIKLLSKIKKQNPNAIVNIISAYGSEESREEARKKGAHSFIDKPFTEREILRSIREVS